MRRIFIAVDIQNNSTLARLVSLYKLALKDEKIRWVDTAGMHLTLAFLGDNDEDRIKRAGDIMSETAGKYKEFEIFFAGTGIFRNIKQPRVLWLDLKVPDVLYNMQALLCKKLEDEGLYKADKSFMPHITLGRMKYIDNRELLSEILKHPGSKNLPPQSVNQLILYESILKPGGPEYYPLKKASLIPAVS
ncbi:MAG TPA: RNA 2',3'-cyclic phosphodiesterase [Bacteroidetes bacterium]|nr:RNA 2',3'-cyclic phosphodiesterase [Bacteroidota bacterium]